VGAEEENAGSLPKRFRCTGCNATFNRDDKVVAPCIILRCGELDYLVERDAFCRLFHLGHLKQTWETLVSRGGGIGAHASGKKMDWATHLQFRRNVCGLRALLTRDDSSQFEPTEYPEENFVKGAPIDLWGIDVPLSPSLFANAGVESVPVLTPMEEVSCQWDGIGSLNKEKANPQNRIRETQPWNPVTRTGGIGKIALFGKQSNTILTNPPGDGKTHSAGHGVKERYDCLEKEKEPLSTRILVMAPSKALVKHWKWELFDKLKIPFGVCVANDEPLVDKDKTTVLYQPEKLKDARVLLTTPESYIKVLDAVGAKDDPDFKIDLFIIDEATHVYDIMFTSKTTKNFRKDLLENFKRFWGGATYTTSQHLVRLYVLDVCVVCV
jgi:hypothetical protein